MQQSEASFLDIFLPDIPASKLKYSQQGGKPIYTRVVDGEEHVITLERLFRFRTYADLLGRQASIPMTYLAGKEHTYGLDWITDAVNPQRSTS